jgi:hypothetical protein
LLRESVVKGMDYIVANTLQNLQFRFITSRHKIIEPFP